MANNKYTNIAFFISPHGFGHAARACAVINAIQNIDPTIFVHIFSSIPKWFIEESFVKNYQYHYFITDIGLIQNDPFIENIDKTIEALDSFIPFTNSEVDGICQYLKKIECRLLLCDISPLGIFLSKNTSINSVLIENFTWDWIYEPFIKDYPKLKNHSKYLNELFGQQKYHVQTEPVCHKIQNSDLITGPVSRTPRTSRLEIRRQLNISNQKKMILITMGGIKSKTRIPKEVTNDINIQYVIPGNYLKEESYDNVLLLPHHSNFYHPDLVNASDAIIAKVGYSTIAESYHAGLPIGYISRPRFRESMILESFVTKEMDGTKIEHLNNELRINQLNISQLLETKISRLTRHNGAEQIANFVLGRLC